MVVAETVALDPLAVVVCTIVDVEQPANKPRIPPEQLVTVSTEVVTDVLVALVVVSGAVVVVPAAVVVVVTPDPVPDDALVVVVVPDPESVVPCPAEVVVAATVVVELVLVLVVVGLQRVIPRRFTDKIPSPHSD